MLFRTSLKSESAVVFSEKGAFLKSMAFHSQMMDATSVGLVTGNCIVIATIFMKKYIVKGYKMSY